MKKPIDVLKTYFETGDKPTQQQFSDLIDSFIHKDEGFVITGTEQTPTGLIISFSDGTTTTLPIFVLQNQEIDFINGLQDFIDQTNQFINNLVLTDNNFTNQNLQDLTNLVAFFDQFQSYSGELSFKEVTFPEVVIGGSTAGEIIDAFPEEIVIKKGQILKLNYYEADFGDGNHARKSFQAIFVLPSGTYGSGTASEGNIYADAYLVCTVKQPDTQSVILNRPFLSFQIDRLIDGNGSDFDVQNQAAFNDKVFDYANAINTASRSIRALRIVENQNISYERHFPLLFEGEKIETDISFILVSAGENYDEFKFNSLVTLTTPTNEAYNKLEMGVFVIDEELVFPALKLTRNIFGSDEILYIKSKKEAFEETSAYGNNTKEIEFKSEFSVGNFGNDPEGIFVVNNMVLNFSNPEKIEFIRTKKPNSQALTTRIGFLEDYCAQEFILNYYAYKADGDGLRFWLNEKEKIKTPFFYSSDYSIRVFKNEAQLVEKEDGRFYYKDKLDQFKGKNKSLIVDDFVNLVKNKFPRVYKCLLISNDGVELNPIFEKNELGDIVKFNYNGSNAISISLKQGFPENKTNVDVGCFRERSGSIVPIFAEWINEDEIILHSEYDFNFDKLKIWLKIEIEPEI